MPVPRLGFLKGGAGPFWLLVGVGVLAILLATSWRVVKGAELEATGKEWSLKVKEAADKLDEGREQLEQENEKLKQEAAERDATWAAAIKGLRAACPGVQRLPPRPAATKPAPVPQKVLIDVAKTAKDARAIAQQVERIRIPKLGF